MRKLVHICSLSLTSVVTPQVLRESFSASEAIFIERAYIVRKGKLR